MYLEVLRKVGLSDGEIKLYDALLELGESTRTKIAKKSGISPSKVYDVANRLLEKGIISYVKKDGIIHFSAADPERLKDFIDKKSKELEEEKKLIDKLIPSLLLKYQKTKEEVDVEVFYGWEGMRTVFEQKSRVLSKGEVDMIFGASMGLDYKQADIFFNKYNKLVDKIGYKIKIIFNEEVRKHRERVAYYEKNHYVKYLFQETFTEIDVHKDYVLFIMLLKKPIVIRIKN
ncbi:MAG: helix-turn-helix domain-containing protein [Candidatus ainarchaeum sp.]|nr:helix-turn-helix domain-containing protein [Candidatus ainarchaeum sp.]